MLILREREREGRKKKGGGKWRQEKRREREREGDKLMKNRKRRKEEKGRREKEGEIKIME